MAQLPTRAESARRSPFLAMVGDPPGWLATLLLAGAIAALAAWTWGKWFHVFIDYGRELYVPWRLSEGDVLYRDLAWFHGPLSAYFNAAAFALLGVGIRTQTLVNLLLIAAVTWLVWRLVRAVADRATALLASLCWLVASAFQYVEWSGNFNWVAPYAHELTHGVALALLAVACLLGLDRRPRLALLGAGTCLGLCCLTKAEVALAGIGAVAAGVVAGAAHRREEVRALALAFAAAAVPVVVSFALLATAMPWSEALRGTLGSWAYTFRGDLRALPYYRITVGTYDVGESLFGIGSWLTTHAVTLLPPVLVAFLYGRRPAWRSAALVLLPLLLLADLALFDTLQAHRVLFGLVPPVISVVAYGSLWLLSLTRLRSRLPAWLPPALAAAPLFAAPWQLIAWEHAFRPLGLYAAAAAAVAVWSAWRSPRGSDAAARAVRLAFPVVALLLLAKIGLWVRIHHYGFALALPALLLTVVLLAHRLPRAVARLGGAGAVVGAAGWTLLLLTLMGLGLRYEHNFTDSPYGEKTRPFGTGADAFYAHTNAITQLYAELGEVVARETNPDDTLVVLPEGVMFNYLWRRVNPTRHVNFMPPELIMFGEDRILADFEARAPKWIVVVHRPSPEYATPGSPAMFGQTFGSRLFRWVLDHYRVVSRAGHLPLRNENEHGVLFMQRKDE